MLGSVDLLIRDKSTGEVRCPMCGDICGRTIAAVKSHYVVQHQRSVSVTLASLPSTSSRNSVPASAPPPSLTDDVEMEDTDVFITSAGVMRDLSPDPGVDDDEEWDARSDVSDASTEVLVEEDVDDIVPRSFNITAPVCDSSDDEHSVSDKGSSVPPSMPQENLSPPFGVCGTDSKHLLFSPTPIDAPADCGGSRTHLRSTALPTWLCDERRGEGRDLHGL